MRLGRIKLQFRGVGAHPWLSVRRNSLTRGTFNRLVGDDRFSSWQLSVEMRWRLKTMISASGFPAYRMAFGSNWAELFGWEDTDEDLTFAQDASLTGQFAHQWKLRMRGREAALKGVANSKLCRNFA